MAEPETARATRRTVVAGTALACVGVACSGLVGGCATYNANRGGVGGAPAQGGATSAGPGSTGPAAAGGDSGAAGSGGTGAVALATTSEVPVGGGKVISAQKVVITQPDAGTFKAFTAVCTHQGCIVDAVANGTIDCPCHGSRYSIKDGSVVSGPAPLPLAPVGIKVEGTSIVLA